MARLGVTTASSCPLSPRNSEKKGARTFGGRRRYKFLTFFSFATFPYLEWPRRATALVVTTFRDLFAPFHDANAGSSPAADATSITYGRTSTLCLPERPQVADSKRFQGTEVAGSGDHPHDIQAAVRAKREKIDRTWATSRPSVEVNRVDGSMLILVNWFDVAD